LLYPRKISSGVALFEAMSQLVKTSSISVNRVRPFRARGCNKFATLADNFAVVKPTGGCMEGRVASNRLILNKKK
jgi:hypothetical protein